MNIRLKPFGDIELVVPERGNEKEAISFLITKKEWIRKTLKKLSEKEKKLTLFDENTVFKTRIFDLKIAKHKRPDVRLQMKNSLLLISYPENISVTDTAVQEAIRFGIEEGLRREAKSFLPGRLAWLASRYGFKFNRVFIKNLRSRWGSCSGVSNINLNLHLMRLPDELIDYVLLHELCHTVEKNHSAAFWALLNEVTGNRAKELDKKMNRYQTTIY